MTRRIPSLALALVPVVALSTGCTDFFDQLTQSSGIVDVFATSHSTPDEDGNTAGRNGPQLIFTNDMGWEVFINEGFVTTVGVTLVSCEGERTDIEMYWGAQAENLSETADAQVNGLGGVRALSGDYCDVLVEYGPSEQAMNPSAMGATVFFTGSALRGDEHIDFIWRSEVEIDAKVDISSLELGQPFRISETQNFSKKLTVSKTFNHFFDGVDFADEYSQADIDDLIADSLSVGTMAFAGTEVP